MFFDVWKLTEIKKLTSFGWHLSHTNVRQLTAVIRAILNEYVNTPSVIPSIPNPETHHLTSCRCYAVITPGKPGEIEDLRSGSARVEEGSGVRQTILVWISMSSRGSPVPGEGRQGRLFVERDDTFGSWWLTIDTWYVTSVVACPWEDRRFYVVDTSFVPVHHVARFKKKKNVMQRKINDAKRHVTRLHIVVITIAQQLGNATRTPKGWSPSGLLLDCHASYRYHFTMHFSLIRARIREQTITLLNCLVESY